MNIALIPFLPDVFLLGLALLVLASDLGSSEGKKSYSIAWMGMAVIALVIVFLPAESRSGALGSYRVTSAILLWKLFFSLAALATIWLSRTYFQIGGNVRGILAKPGAYFALLILCTQGMFALVSATDFLTFYIGMELATLPLYALAAFQPNDSNSVEAGSKYVLMGGFSSALFLFGISLLYGASGGIGFSDIAAVVQEAASRPLLLGGVIFILGGLGFKLAMAPFHMWAPDIYEGAPTPVMAFLSVGSKIAAVAATASLLYGPLDLLRPDLARFIIIAAVFSWVVGNLGAMRQRNLRRFVAYSSIAQVGYMLLAFLGDATLGRQALQYNLLAYGLTSFGLYFIMSILGKDSQDTFSSLRGLSRRNPSLAMLLLLCMFSLAGIPPLAGFIGKFMLFSSAAQEGYYSLIGIAVVNAVVSFYYYMLLVKEAYIVPESDPVMDKLTLSWRQKGILAFLSIGLVVLGTCPALWNGLASRGGP